MHKTADAAWLGWRKVMTLMRLVYASRPAGFDDAILSNILTVLHQNNTREGITGTLVCRDDLYIQLLEGDRPQVEARFKRICEDPRHRGVAPIVAENTEKRLFPAWAMRHDPAKNWMWTREQVIAGVVDTATRDEVLAMFVRLVTEKPGPLSGAPMRARA